MSRKKMLVLVCVVIVIILLSIFLPSETSEESTTKIRKEAFDYAIQCSQTKTPPIKFEDINWIIIPGNVIKFKAIDGTAYFLAWTDVVDSTIYIVEKEEQTEWVIAHEVLHMLGYIGHPIVPFRTCGLMVDQNS